MSINGVKYDNDKLIANKLNEFYVNSIHDIQRSIVCVNIASDPSIIIPEMSTLFKFNQVTLEDLEKTVKSFNNKFNKNDLINAKVLKDAFD